MLHQHHTGKVNFNRNVTRQRQLGDFALRMDSTTPHAKDVGETSIYENTLDYSIYSFHVCVCVCVYIYINNTSGKS